MAVRTGGPSKPSLGGDGFIAPPSRPAPGPGRKPARWGREPAPPETFPPTEEGRDILQQALNVTPPQAPPTETTVPEPDPIQPEPSPDPLQEDEDGYILVKIPKADFIKLVQETIMSQKNQNTADTNANANVDATAAGATANAQTDQVQAKDEAGPDNVKVDVTTAPTPAAGPTKKKTWQKIGSHLGAVLVGAGLTVGVQLLAKRYNLPLPTAEGGEVEA